jgi:hypothetical protein
MIEVLIRLANKWPPAAREEFEERVAIAQFCGKQTEAQAYVVAFECVGVRLKEGMFRDQ